MYGNIGNHYDGGISQRHIQRHANLEWQRRNLGSKCESVPGNLYARQCKWIHNGYANVDRYEWLQ